MKNSSKFPLRAPAAFVAALIAGIAGCRSGDVRSSGDFTVSSADVADGKRMSSDQEFDGMDGRGKNIFPELSWENAPAGTRSFALTVYDPDAPTGSGWWHYVLVNIPAGTNELARGAGNDAARLPAGAQQVRNDYGFFTFGGACPPKGDKPHRYIFTIHALKVAHLDIPKDATAALAGFMIHANEIAATRIVPLYAR